MSYPLSANVSAGDPTLSAHYNNLRSDALLLGQPAADAVTLASLLERYESRLTLERLSTDRLRVPASAAAPVSIIIAGIMVQAVTNIDLATGEKPSGDADEYYIFANRIAGSTTFTLTVNTSITEGANQRLIGRFYWDGTAIVKDSVRTEQANFIKSLLYFVEPQVCEGRLTLTTGVPVPTAEVNTSGTVYFTPYIGSRIALYVENYGWRLYEFEELALDISGVAAGKNIDIWVYDNAGTLTMALTEWSNDLLRATALERQDGVLVKSGAPAYRYLGTVRTFNTGVTCDNLKSRHVWNYYNRVQRQLIALDSTNSWTYTTAATWRMMNNSAANRVTFVIGVDETVVNLAIAIAASHSSTAYCPVGIGLDVTNDNTAQLMQPMKGDQILFSKAQYIGNPGIGYHFLQMLEYCVSGTNTYYGDNNLPTYLVSGGIGFISC